ncbi:EAL domain-containing protein [Clostridium paridis]|uniref:EAL domain-containing protein n=1 Tax=Clostridium paridis TaxID=2803863 RepID=A0A937FFR3_9CLOT|nr:EAL domain-containing protein [Clostridium paridis]MBL4932363.1 EAL domain-containing protein [Clostridium paridis]
MKYLENFENAIDLIKNGSKDAEKVKKIVKDLYDQLKYNETTKKLIIEGAADYVFEWNIEEDYFNISEDFINLVGLTNVNSFNRKELSKAFDILIHDDDRNRVKELIYEFLDGENEYFICECRILRNDGEYAWIYCKGKGIHDEAGRPLLMAGSILDISEKKSYEDYIIKMAFVDQLTLLPNRLKFEHDFNNLTNNDFMGENKFSIFMFDIDNFKNFNDTFGCNLGDKVIKEISEFLSSLDLEAYSSYRIGGDSFILLVHQEDKNDIILSLNKILNRFKSTWNISGYEYYFTTSIGVVSYPKDGKDVETILKNVESALFKSKQEGKNRYTFYSKEHHDRFHRQIQLENSMRCAVNNNFDGFYVVYQPIVDSNTKNLVTVESLLRWDHKELGMISPLEFIPIAETSGLIVPMGEWILKEAICQCSAWRIMGINNLTVNVNLSVKQLQVDGFDKMVMDLLKEAELPSEALTLEITESLIMTDFTHTSRILENLRNEGVKISIDDFGTGYSSLSYLRKLPVDNLKIDRSFISDIESDKYCVSFTDTMINLAHNLNITVTSEGVETESQLNILENLGSDYIQGYYFSKPMTPAELVKYVDAYI